MAGTVTVGQLLAARELAKAHREAWGQEQLVFGRDWLMVGQGTATTTIPLSDGEVPIAPLLQALTARWGKAAPDITALGVFFHATATKRLRWEVDRERVQVEVFRPTPEGLIDVVLQFTLQLGDPKSAAIVPRGPYAQRHVEALFQGVRGVLGWSRAARLVAPFRVSAAPDDEA